MPALNAPLRVLQAGKHQKLLDILFNITQAKVFSRPRHVHQSRILLKTISESGTKNALYFVNVM